MVPLAQSQSQSAEVDNEEDKGLREGRGNEKDERRKGEYASSNEDGRCLQDFSYEEDGRWRDEAC